MASLADKYLASLEQQVVLSQELRESRAENQRLNLLVADLRVELALLTQNYTKEPPRTDSPPSTALAKTISDSQNTTTNANVSPFDWNQHFSIPHSGFPSCLHCSMQMITKRPTTWLKHLRVCPFVPPPMVVSIPTSAPVSITSSNNSSSRTSPTLAKQKPVTPKMQLPPIPLPCLDEHMISKGTGLSRSFICKYCLSEYRSSARRAWVKHLSDCVSTPISVQKQCFELENELQSRAQAQMAEKGADGPESPLIPVTEFRETSRTSTSNVSSLGSVSSTPSGSSGVRVPETCREMPLDSHVIKKRIGQVRTISCKYCKLQIKSTHKKKWEEHVYACEEAIQQQFRHGKGHPMHRHGRVIEESVTESEAIDRNESLAGEAEELEEVEEILEEGFSAVTGASGGAHSEKNESIGITAGNSIAASANGASLHGAQTAVQSVFFESTTRNIGTHKADDEYSDFSAVDEDEEEEEEMRKDQEMLDGEWESEGELDRVESNSRRNKQGGPVGHGSKSGESAFGNQIPQVRHYGTRAASPNKKTANSALRRLDQNRLLGIHFRKWNAGEAQE
ncbi:hypothetical protein HDU81_002269 [Chytriomyces hyalinus]|nr:hypothetical protein HDU81_002269 [Chytriomyces hyalinus]